MVVGTEGMGSLKIEWVLQPREEEKELNQN